MREILISAALGIAITFVIVLAVVGAVGLYATFHHSEDRETYSECVDKNATYLRTHVNLDYLQADTQARNSPECKELK